MVEFCFYSKSLWKESLNSDGQQLHQYQQNEQLPRSSTKKRLEHMALEMNVMTYDKHKKRLS